MKDSDKEIIKKIDDVLDRALPERYPDEDIDDHIGKPCPNDEWDSTCVNVDRHRDIDNPINTNWEAGHIPFEQISELEILAIETVCLELAAHYGIESLRVYEDELRRTINNALYRRTLNDLALYGQAYVSYRPTDGVQTRITNIPLC